MQGNAEAQAVSKPVRGCSSACHSPLCSIAHYLMVCHPVATDHDFLPCRRSISIARAIHCYVVPYLKAMTTNKTVCSILPLLHMPSLRFHQTATCYVAGEFAELLWTAAGGAAAGERGWTGRRPRTCGMWRKEQERSGVGGGGGGGGELEVTGREEGVGCVVWLADMLECEAVAEEEAVLPTMLRR